MNDEEPDQNGEPEPGQQLEITIEPAQRAGVWANWAQVSHSEHEFTLDFVRLDPLMAGKGIVVARVAVSPLFITQLIDALQTNWQGYAEKALPQEVQDAGTIDEDKDQGGEAE